MPRISKARALAVWVNGELVGEWRLRARGDMEFQYRGEWTESREGRPISLSLPFNLDNAAIRRPAVEAYFDNLLPESEPIRRRLQERFKTSGGPFDLLSAIGRDCVGAVQLLPQGEQPDTRRVHATPLTAGAVERILAGVVSPSALRLGEQYDDAFRISIAGTQEKTALLWHNEQWCVPHGTTPSTHIFKLPLGRIAGLAGAQIDLSTSIENEWLCARILAAYGIPIAECTIGHFGDHKALVVTRFDRQLHPDGYWLRVMQEDFCQATGTPASRKYEQDGGPGISRISEILRGSVQRDQDLATFMKAQILFWMLAAIDGHAKNFSLFILREGHYRLTPLYDVISAWPFIGRGADNIPYEKASLAMGLRGKNAHYRISEIQRRHFDSTAARAGVARSAQPLIDEILRATPGVLATVARQIPKGFPQQILDSIFAGLDDASQRLSAATTR